jgi:hypothetical protein
MSLTVGKIATSGSREWHARMTAPMGPSRGGIPRSTNGHMRHERIAALRALAALLYRPASKADCGTSILDAGADLRIPSPCVGQPNESCLVFPFVRPPWAAPCPRLAPRPGSPRAKPPPTASRSDPSEGSFHPPKISARTG